jgi:hypothetical protein
VRKTRRSDVQRYMIRTLIPERPIKIPMTSENDTPFMWIDPDA